MGSRFLICCHQTATLYFGKNSNLNRILISNCYVSFFWTWSCTLHVFSELGNYCLGARKLSYTYYGCVRKPNMSCLLPGELNCLYENVVYGACLVYPKVILITSLIFDPFIKTVSFSRELEIPESIARHRWCQFEAGFSNYSGLAVKGRIIFSCS